MPTARFAAALAGALIAVSVSLPALAQRAEPRDGSRDRSSTDRQALDRDHTRHTHQRNPDHPTTIDATRFTTNRPSPVVLPLPAEREAFSFVVFGDRTGGPDEGIAVLKDAVRDANLLEPDLVMTVGDMIDGYNTTPDWLQEMHEYKSAMNELICPWFPVAGNHDVYWRGPDAPEDQHESNYELHFGPLWYAFEHKNCWFIALYSDEGDPATGEKAFRDPEAQRMSPEQFEWLESILEKAAGADHVFAFLHHPRWRGGGYGDDWDRVHRLLADAGNVSAVFAGHIHRMKYQQQDGIEYFTLATVGGSNRFTVPRAGNLHHYNVVTVREDQIAVSAIPVGEAIDPRELTEDFTEDAYALADLTPQVEGSIELTADGSATGRVTATLTNPTGRPVEMMLGYDSDDSRWIVVPDHVHGTLEPGATQRITLEVRRVRGELDATYQPVDLVLSLDLLTPAFRYEIPSSRAPVPVDVSEAVASFPRGRAGDRALRTGRDAAVVVASDTLDLPDGPLTVEAWVKPDRAGGRGGIVAKTEGSEFGIHLGNNPHFSVHVGGDYEIASADPAMFEPGRWYHLAGVFDGRENRFYVNGRLVEAVPASGARRTNDLPLIIGADVGRGGRPTSFFDGLIDDVRISTTARYTGTSFAPPTELRADGQTSLLITFDDAIGPYLFDDSGRNATAELYGDAVLVPSDR